MRDQSMNVVQLISAEFKNKLCETFFNFQKWSELSLKAPSNKNSNNFSTV